MTKISLNFAAVECDGCAGVRQAAQPCPHCGRKSKRQEVDHHLVARRTRIDKFRAARHAARKEPPALADLNRVPDLLQSALRSIGEWCVKGRHLDRMLRAFEELDSVVAAWPAEALPRPDRNHGRRISELLRRMGIAVDLFLQAAYAETMGQAQELEAEGNNHLKASGYDEAFPETWTEIAAAALRRVGSVSALPTLDQELSQSYSTVREGSNYPVGMGLQLFLLDLVTDQLFDRANVELIRAEAHRVLSEQKPRLAALATDVWRAEALRTGRLNAAAWRTLALVVANESDDLETAEALLSLTETSREISMRFSAATLLAAAGEDWEQLQGKRTGFLIQQADKRFPWLQLGSAGRQLRDLSAHKAFDVADGRVVERLEGGGMRTYSGEEFIDKCLHALEVAWALQGAIYLAAGEAGVAWPSHLSERREDREAAMTFTCRLMNMDCSAIAWHHDRVELTVTGQPQTWPGVISALTPILPQSVPRLDIHATHGDHGATEVIADLAALRAFFDRPEDDPFDTEARLLVEALLSITVDGTQQVPPSWWEGLVWHAAAQRKGDTAADQARRLLSLRPLIARLDNPAITGTFSMALSAVRVGALSTPVDVPSWLRTERTDPGSAHI